MQLFPGAEILELPMQGFGGTSVVHPVLLMGEEGATLVDTGFPGQGAALDTALQAHGLTMAEIDRVILTHQDIDHIGNLPALAAGRATVLAHSAEAPYIEGRERLLKFNPERMQRMLERMPEAAQAQFRNLMSNPPKAQVDVLLEDGEELPLYGGIRIIHTPGHTPGHISLYFPKHRTLISGDAMRVVNGQLEGPGPEVTPDMDLAHASLAKVPKDVEYILCYHGGLFGPGAARRLAEIAG
jgi:glyoxylase-like metal-dependent hydrolase (beta-lactamase superfamily II)